MASNGNANPGRDTSKSDGAASSLERRPTPTEYSTSNHRFSYASNETAESSTAASKRDSLAIINNHEEVDNDNDRDAVDVSQAGLREGRGSHRSRRSRQSAGFLLPNTNFERPSRTSDHQAVPNEHLPRPRASSGDHKRKGKGKGKLQSQEQRHTTRKSNPGLGIGGSPLASNVTTAGHGNGAANGLHGDPTADSVGVDTESSTKATSNALDVDSAQIVNLALNLSESRRNAARRNVSTPLPPSAGLTDGFTGGNLRQHLQQQRRVSRNVSPKPDRNDLTMTAASPRLGTGHKVNSPLQTAFESAPDNTYQYHFSASTLARAERAKNAIELMAHYRRLLQYVPPLKPQALERPATASPPSTSNGSSTASTFSPIRMASTTNSGWTLGRQYNPLQYIRNRKVRARERKAFDGEAQGFGDLEKVSSWVEQLSKWSEEDRKTADYLPLPDFSHAANEPVSPRGSLQDSHGKSKPAAPKFKRPRIDWVTNAADMIADVFWLEQEDNKKLIEDRHGRKVFPQDADLRRPISRQSEKPEAKSPEKDDPARNLRIDTKTLPEFISVKSDSDRHLDQAASKARQRLREATRFHHGHNGSTRDRRFLSHSRSNSNSSESDSDSRPHQPRRSRSGTADSNDRGKDILEKQMTEMLAEEARDNELGGPPDVEGQRILHSIETQKPMLKDSSDNSRAGSGRHTKTASRVIKGGGRLQKESLRNGSSGRPSLEVPGSNPRSSLEEFDSTAPSSPDARASRANAFIPSISMDLSPSHSRQASPNRNPLSRVRSMININTLQDRIRDHSRDPSRERERAEEAAAAGESPGSIERVDSPVTPETVKRSKSPAKKIMSRRTDDSNSSIKDRTASLRGKGVEESSGIRGLFKSGRVAVAKVSDVIWKKDPSPSLGTSSGVSTDSSDAEDARELPFKVVSSQDRSSSVPPEIDDASPQKDRQSFLSSMPTFTSPFERRGRERFVSAPGDPTAAEDDYAVQRQQTREERRRSSRLDVPPRIDVQNASPASSPDLQPSGRFRLDSDVSDLDAFNNGYSNGVYDADARLDAILGLPGKRRDQLPITGLSKLEISHAQRPSMEGKRQWSISDRGVSVRRGPMTKREIARVRALLLSSGIKAKEIARRGVEPHDLRNPDQTPFSDIAGLTEEPTGPVSRAREHILAARILSHDIQLSSRIWQTSVDNFCNTTISGLLSRVDSLQSYVAKDLTPMARKASDEADEVSKDLVTSQTLAVKRLTDMMDKMMRRRRRRFRWLRRGGWVMVEWALVGVMWYVWFIVVLARIVIGFFKGLLAVVRWLFCL